jgi:alanyl-tRNA synthetase
MITREELIRKYIEFFKRHHHKHIPSASLIPENDPTVLFTTAGMHPIVPFLLGQKHPLGKRLVNVQKCIRTGDIEEVGDTTHHTFFEMLGNWSLGDYFKEDAIKFSFEFLTEELKIPLNRLAITCFKGDKNSPKDEESEKIWRKLGIPEDRIAFLGKENNWWGPAGTSGPCGPDSEMFYWKPNNKIPPKKFNPDDNNWVEIWNDVFMQYNKTKEGKYQILEQKNVDTGMGVERTLTILNNLEDNYKSEIFKPIINEIEKISKKTYGKNEEDDKSMRIIADHIRASTLILGDDKSIRPSNTDQGYVLRRLIRRAIRYGHQLNIKESFTHKIAKIIIPLYKEYNELQRNHKIILEELKNEEEKFNLTLEKGLKKFKELSLDKIISGKEAFLLFQSYGFPIEMTQELADEKGIKVDFEEYNTEFKKHQDLSRTASIGKFKSGLADDSESTRKLHTATHILNEVLRVVLKDKTITQRGSNITPERLRFDFNFSRKLTEEEKEEIEKKVNEIIDKNLEVSSEEMPLEQAIKSGAQAEFGNKYPEMVSVYTIHEAGNKSKWFSKEICTGPHVRNTSEIGKFKIKKEESSSSGIRRIKAVLG